MGRPVSKVREAKLELYRKKGKIHAKATSGHFNTHSLNNAIEVMGADRVMFSVDYPYEDIHQACDWFDPLELEAGLKEKIAWGNASRVFNIK